MILQSVNKTFFLPSCGVIVISHFPPSCLLSTNPIAATKATVPSVFVKHLNSPVIPSYDIHLTWLAPLHRLGIAAVQGLSYPIQSRIDCSTFPDLYSMLCRSSSSPSVFRRCIHIQNNILNTLHRSFLNT